MVKSVEQVEQTDSTAAAVATDEPQLAPPPRRGPETIARAPASGGFLMRARMMNGLQAAAGNARAGRLAVQAKLTVARTDDPYEREADEFAQRKCPAWEASEHRREERDPNADAIHRASIADGAGEAPAVDPDVEARIKSPGGGRPLPSVMRREMESAIGADFSSVRVHDGGRDRTDAGRLNAKAFTHGSDIWIGSSGSAGDRELMAHELTHIAQQGGDVRRRATTEAPPSPTEEDAGNRAHASALPDASLQPPAAAIDGGVPTAVPEATAPADSGGCATAVTTLQRSVGNARLSRIAAAATVRRQPNPTPPPAGGGGGPALSGRVVYIDANIVIHINRGNAPVANALRQMRASGVELRISPTQHAELVTRPDIPRTATAQRLILEEMGIRPGAAPSLAQRVDVNIAGATTSGGNIMQPRDQNLVASARADGRSVEIWSLDTPFTSNPRQVETTYGVRVAPESQLPVAGGQRDYRVGRQLLGLEPVEISLMGEVTRTAPPSGGPGGGGTGPGGGPPGAPPSGGPAAGGSFGTGTRVVAGAVGIIVVVNEILGGINRVRNIQQYNIDIGNAEVAFWERFGASPTRGVWDQVGRRPLPPNTTPSTSLFGSPSYPYVVDINVDGLRRTLPRMIENYQDFLYFLDAGKSLGVIEEDPLLPEHPTAAQRTADRHYFAWVNREDRHSIHAYDITHLITSVRNASLGELEEEMRLQAGALPPAQQDNVYRLKRGPDTPIYRSAGGGQPIITSAQLLGSDPWVRPLGRRVDVGGWFSTDIRVLVAPVNADAQRAALVSGYWVKQSIEDTLEEAEEGGRPILDRQPTEGLLQSFVAGPEPGSSSRFGQTRYYRHADPDMRWTIALGEIREFWVQIGDLERVPRSAVESYATPSTPVAAGP